MNWIFGNPCFEYRNQLDDIDSPWSGHCHFGYDLVINNRPKLIVELGTWKGTSLFTFAQAIKDANLKCQLHAIDTWQGDDHTGAYSEAIFQTFHRIAKDVYSDVPINIHRMLFDKALENFEDESIDILHIDGLHTYEAAKHDFETWLPKCSKNAVILFHDTAIKTRDFGVYKLWEELRENYTGIEFGHSYGLGVLYLNESRHYLKDENQFVSRYYLSAYTEIKQDMRKTKTIEREYNDLKNSILFKGMNLVRLILGRRP